MINDQIYESAIHIKTVITHSTGRRFGHPSIFSVIFVKLPGNTIIPIHFKSAIHQNIVRITGISRAQVL
jgi:hypothetical protein